MGPNDPYLTDCWTAVLGPGQVLCYRRLHQLVGAEVPVGTLAQSLGIGNAGHVGRLQRCVDRLAAFGALTLNDELCRLAPGLRFLTRGELSRPGPIVRGLHEAHLRRLELQPTRAAGLAADGARSFPERRRLGLAMESA